MATSDPCQNCDGDGYVEVDEHGNEAKCGACAPQATERVVVGNDGVERAALGENDGMYMASRHFEDDWSVGETYQTRQEAIDRYSDDHGEPDGAHFKTAKLRYVREVPPYDADSFADQAADAASSEWNEGAVEQFMDQWTPKVTAEFNKKLEALWEQFCEKHDMVLEGYFTNDEQSHIVGDDESDEELAQRAGEAARGARCRARGGAGQSPRPARSGRSGGRSDPREHRRHQAAAPRRVHAHVPVLGQGASPHRRSRPMIAYLVWDKDNSEREYAKSVRAVDAETAAQEIAEREYDDEPFTGMRTYCVFDPRVNTTTVFDIEVDFDVTFTAYNERSLEDPL